jgi:hypothetical protein
MLKEQTEIHLDEEGFAWALLAKSTPGDGLLRDSFRGRGVELVDTC